MAERSEQGEPEPSNEETDRFGSGATGNWTEEELDELPETDATSEGATREDDDPEALREGRAKANRPETDEAPEPPTGGE